MSRYIPPILLVLSFIACNSSAPDRSSIVHATNEYVALPSSKGLTYDSLNITTSDGARLTGWLLRPNVATSDAVVRLAGGDAGNMSYALEYARYMIDALGAPILLFDYRGFGTSDAFAIDPN